MMVRKAPAYAKGATEHRQGRNTWAGGRNKLKKVDSLALIVDRRQAKARRRSNGVDWKGMRSTKV